MLNLTLMINKILWFLILNKYAKYYRLTIGFESTSQDTLTVCLIAALIIVDSAEQTGGSV